MKAITISLLFTLFSSLAYSQVSLAPLEKKHSFEIEALTRYKRLGLDYGLGLAYKYSINRNFAIRQSIRYIYAPYKTEQFGVPNSTYSHMQYSIDGLYSFGKNKSWEASLGLIYERIYEKETQQISNKGDHSAYGLQLGLGKTFQMNGNNRFSIGGTAAYTQGNGLIGGLRLGYIIP